MYYENKYEYLNQESRLPLLKVLKKYNISEEDMKEIEEILWWTYDKYDDVGLIASFYEEKFDPKCECFNEYMEYREDHKKLVDYTKLSQISVYEELD